MDAANNVVTYLQQAASHVGDRVALVLESDDGATQQTTFAQLWDQVDRVSVGLRHAGLAPGDRAIIMIPMSIDLYVALLAVLKAGSVAVFVDPWMGARQIAAFASFASPTAYLGVAKSHLLRLLTARLRRIPLSITTGRRFWRIPARRSLAEVAAARGDGEVHPVAADDPALITFTSGSSGVPKGANRTHGFLSAQHLALKHEFPYREDDIDMPMFPVFALNNLAGGVPSIIPRMDFRRVADVDGKVIVEQMKRRGVTTSTASPPFFDRILQQEEPDLRRILTGGAPVSDLQLETWRRASPNTEVMVVYGSTEAEPVAHIDAVDRLSLKVDDRPNAPGFCVGQPTSLVRTKLIRIENGPVSLSDGDWAPWTVKAGEIGELVVAGKHVCKDYFQNPQAVRENKIVDGEGGVWHRMGDTGYFDTQGRFWLVGRVHSTILHDGLAVHPQLVEQAAQGADERIRRAAAIGVNNRVTVVVETDAGSEIRDTVAERLKASRQPFDEIVVTNDSLPVDPRHNSKIDYEALRIRLQKPALTPSSPFYRRLLAYLHERFPLVGNGLLIVSYYSSNQFLARALTRPGEPMEYDRGSLLGAVTLLCIFFHLRVFDEHKDYEEDLKHYPDRVLQSGLITLAHLKVLGAAAIAVELLLSAIWSPAALVSVLIALVFSWLMLKEFFVGEWLRRHFLIYAVSHMLIMPLLALVVYSFATQRYAWQAPAWYWLYAFVGFFVTFNWEISRKIRSPEDERAGVETYTKILGVYGAGYAVLAVRFIDTGMVALVGLHLQLSVWFYMVLIVLFAVSMIGFLHYRFHTTPKTAKRMETYAGLYIIAFDLTLAIELIRKFGITFVV